MSLFWSDFSKNLCFIYVDTFNPYNKTTGPVIIVIITILQMKLKVRKVK